MSVSRKFKGKIGCGKILEQNPHMKIAFIILSLFIVGCLLLLFLLGFISRSGKASGLVAGHLARCPAKPNCVCSEQRDDGGHYVSPILVAQDIGQTLVPILKSIVWEMGGTIRAEKEYYFAATFSSAIFGFVDDFEVRIDLPLKMIHIRSASRVGYGDAGVNRKRAELFKKIYEQKRLEASPSFQARKRD